MFERLYLFIFLNFGTKLIILKFQTDINSNLTLKIRN